ncbi:MAG TPA: hypothetical protein VE631_03905, partial [Alphaproteobacteria bacterium]|nr:hypothetical protein [Alphaproteobacteria bacterium]
SVVEEQRRPLTDIALVITDRSPSQEVGQRRQRTDAALQALADRLHRERGLETRFVDAGRAGQARPGQQGTRLVGAMQQALADLPQDRLAGVLMLTDGQVHDVPDDLAPADPGAPVHVLLTGRRNERDRRLKVVQAPAYGIVGEEMALQVVVEDQGGKGGSARLRLTQDGENREQTVTVGEPTRVPFRLGHSGTTVLELATPPGPQELTLRNNRAVLAVNGVRERLRVLLVSGEPHAGERTWRNILKSDPSVDLVHFTILRPPEKQDGTSIRELSLIAFPTRELFQTKLHEFDLIIFDRYRRRGVLPDSYLRNVADYVEGGGAVLIAAGPAFASPFSLDRTPLATVLPSHPTGRVEMRGYRPRLTTEGRRHPVTADLPGAGQHPGDRPGWGRWFRLVDVDRMRGEVLMQGPTRRPLLILDRVGQGRVAQLLSDHAWLWTRGYEGGGPQAELLRRIAHWLMKEPDLEEEDLRAQVEGERIKIVRRSLTPGGPPVTVTAPSGEKTKVKLQDDEGGRETGSLRVEEPGLYHLGDGRHKAVVAVGDVNPLEYADLRTTPDRLAPLVKRTGGGSFWLEDGLPSLRRVAPERAAAGHDWLGLRSNGGYVVTGVRQYPVLPGLAVLLLFLGVTMLAWRREGG